MGLRFFSRAAVRVALGAALFGCGEGGSAPATPTPSVPVTLRPLRVSADRRIVDDQDREVLLRGVNLTSLGEYWQGDADHLPTEELTELDWQALQEQGFSVLRLVVHWSRLEPTRGSFDLAYLARVDDYVRRAAAHGLYTILDMHQDAYTAFLHTDRASDCPAGTAPAKGWDGAPRWAVRDEGLSTCTTGDRNSSPAVTAAWKHFYANTDGLRDRFVATWGALAAHFAGRPEVAGYDLLNEPEVPAPSEEVAPAYNQLLAEVVTAIRQAEAGAPFGHLLVVELAFAAGHPAYGIVIPSPASVGLDPTNLVFGPHNYAEAIGNGLNLTLEGMSDAYDLMAQSLGAPLWIGEHGFWDTAPATLEKLARYARDEDARALGGAWWQWRQPCGDPHSVPWGGYAATGQQNVQVHLHTVACPGDVDLGPTEPFLRVVSRAYPRAAPGRITRLQSDFATGALTVEARDARAGAAVEVWTPTPDGAPHAISATGLGDLVAHTVPGGRWLTATVTANGPWSLRIAGAGGDGGGDGGRP